jgi:hypothetical protein
MHDGELYPLPVPAHLTDENESGLLPTPRANKIGGYSSEGWRPTLEQAVKYPTPVVTDAKNSASPSTYRRNSPQLAAVVTAMEFATPRASDANGHQIQPGKQGGLGLNQQLGGLLNPTWVDWLMGYPIGWSALEPMATGKFRSWQQQHGVYSQEDE